MISSRLAGALTAGFLLVGRWEPARDPLTTYVAGRQVGFGEPRFIIAAALVAVAATLPLTRNRVSRSPGGRLVTPQHLALTLGIFLVLSAAWSIAPPEAIAKGSEIVLLIVVAVIFGIATSRPGGKIARDAFWVSLIGASLLLGMLGAYQVVGAETASTDRYVVAPLGGGPNVFGRNMAVLTIALVALSLSRRIPGRIGLPAATVAGLLVVLSGSRGALLALAVGLFFAVALTRPRARTLVIAAVMLVLTLILLAGWTSTLDQAGVVIDQRLDLGRPENQFSYTRANLFQEGISCYVGHPVTGAGLAGFVGIGRTQTYPHNTFLEIACEGGSVGLLLALLLLTTVLATLWKARSLVDPLPAAVFMAALVAAQFSGDIFDSRGLVVFGILALGPHRSDRPDVDRSRKLSG